MDKEKTREAARRFGEELREKLFASRRGLTIENLVGRPEQPTEGIKPGHEHDDGSQERR